MKNDAFIGKYNFIIYQPVERPVIPAPKIAEPR
jgi:hypothetical protein